MGDGPIKPVTIDTMLNCNVLNVGEGLNFFTCEETFSFNLIFRRLQRYNGRVYTLQRAELSDTGRVPPNTARCCVSRKV